MQQKQQQKQQQPGHFGNLFEKVQTHVAQAHLAFSDRKRLRFKKIAKMSLELLGLLLEPQLFLLLLLLRAFNHVLLRGWEASPQNSL